jgi:hypothetical protein
VQIDAYTRRCGRIAYLAAGAGIDRRTLDPAGSAVNLPIEQPRMPPP